MRILIHDFGGYSFCLELSREIAARGHNVQYVYFPAFSGSMQNMERRSNDPANLEIIPLGADLPYTRYNSLFQRRSQEIAYGRRLKDHIAEWRPDIVVSANTPLDVQRQAEKSTRAVRGRFVFWQQDIISAAMSAILTRRFGIVGSLIASYYESVERRIALQSDAVICIAEDFLPALRRWGIPAERCHVIENWAPKDDIRPRPKDNSWSRSHGLADKKVFLYSGRLGLKHNPEALWRLAEDYRNSSDTVILVVAEGQGADWLAAQKLANTLDNLSLLPFQPYVDLPDVLATGDVLVCVFETSAHLYSVPSKILSYLAAGRAILAAMPRDNINAKHILRIGAGRVVSPEAPEEMLAAARALIEDNEQREICARNARQYAEQAFDVRLIADRFLKILMGRIARP